MDLDRALKFSLADFAFPDSDDPLVPEADYVAWRQAATYRSLFEPRLLGPPAVRTTVLHKGRAQPVLNLASYHYMGLNQHPEVIAGAKKALDDYGFGTGGSALLSGFTGLHDELQTRVTAWLKREEAMLFPSGFGGAMSAVAGLLRKGDVAILDELAHASLHDGAKVAGAQIVTFAHNSAEGLDAALKKHAGKRRLIALDGVYSMDGDFADLPALIPVAKQHGVGIVIDEAHSILAWGPAGTGVVGHFGFTPKDVALQVGTFSKAFSGMGSFVAGTAATMGYLRYFANSYAFSGALASPMVGGILAGLNVATRDEVLRTQLHENAVYFRTQLQKLGINTGKSQSQIVPIVIGDNRRLLYELCDGLRDRGLFVPPVDFPAVPETGLRFRANVTAAHTRADLDEALNIIADTVVPRLKAGR